MKKKLVLIRKEGTQRSSSAQVIQRVQYGECMKNHAASSGGYAVDGCREFIAAAGEGGLTVELSCAACGCHRNFHRREVESRMVSESSSPPVGYKIGI